MIVEAIEFVRPVEASGCPFGSTGGIFPDRSGRNSNADHDGNFFLRDEIIEHRALEDAQTIEFDQQAGWFRRIVLSGHINLKPIFGARENFGIVNGALKNLAMRNVGVRLRFFGRISARKFRLDLLYE